MALTSGGVAPAPDAKGAALFDILHAAGVALDGTALTLVSRWVTPEYAPKRFDTWFYLAPVGATPEIRLDTDELVGSMWIPPGDALDGHDRGDLEMFLPTIAHLRWLRLREDTEDALAAARGADGRSLIAPQRMEDGSIVPIHMPADP
jgi:hypothetical protein